MFVDKRRRSYPRRKYPQLYGKWRYMLSRCYDEFSYNYEGYGGRGIFVCDEWKTSFYAFARWAINNGWYEGCLLQIDRIDNYKGYTPDNCRLVSAKENARNRRDNVLLEYNGWVFCVAEWAEILKISTGVIGRRLYVLNWSVKDALEVIPKRGRNEIKERANVDALIKEWFERGD